MGLKRWIAARWAEKRYKAIRRIHADPFASQDRTLGSLIKRAAQTEFGKKHGFATISDYASFRKNVPVGDYEKYKSFFEKIRQGKADICWPGKPLYLAKTSGTVSGSKYIPITKESIRYQIKGARDALLMYIRETGNSSFLDGNMMFLSGSPELETNEFGVKVGRLSGIVNHFVPAYLRRNQIPSYETNCIEDWETKVEKILDETLSSDLRLISGIPPWVQMYFEKLQEKTGEMPLDKWPNLGVFVQGGVDFSPYESVFKNYFKGKVDMIEVYPASEGFFAFQDSQKEEGLLLNLDYGIFYEFIPLEEYGKKDARRLCLKEVELETQYALIVSTNAGLWAYDIGDTVKFVSKDPFRLKVTGRVKHFISAFGEHVIGEEVNAAMVKACETNDCEINEFTVAPMLNDGKGESYHEWFVEFATEPKDFEVFCNTIDEEMRKQNVYYNDLREGNMLIRVVVRKLQANATREYMKSIGKLGGQNKFPKLSNDRKIAEALKEYIIQ